MSKKITFDNLSSCDPFNCYCLLDKNGVIYKLQAVDKIYLPERKDCHFAFCALDDSVYYGYGIIDSFYECLRKILKMNCGVIVELKNFEEIMDFISYNIASNKKVIQDIETIKWNLSVKKQYNIGFFAATIMYLAGETPETTSNK